MADDNRKYNAPDGSPRIIATRTDRESERVGKTVRLIDPASGAALAFLHRTLLVGRPDFGKDGSVEFDLEAPASRWRVRVYRDRTFITHPHDMESRPLSDLALEIGAGLNPPII